MRGREHVALVVAVGVLLGSTLIFVWGLHREDLRAAELRGQYRMQLH